jgi:hypothetical protein
MSKKRTSKDKSGRSRGSGENAAWSQGEIMDPGIETIVDLVGSVSDLARRAVVEHAPVVDLIVRRRSRDVRHIEHTLDGLLDFCLDPGALVLFRKLCRHYYFIDPSAAAEYVYAYRDMWDSEAEDLT